MVHAWHSRKDRLESSVWGIYRMHCCYFVDHHGQAEARSLGTHLSCRFLLWCESVFTKVTINLIEVQ